MCRTEKYFVFVWSVHCAVFRRRLSMRRASASKGYILCFVFNLLLRLEWVAFALVLYLLHYWAGISAWFCFAALAIWVLSALLLTALTAWGSASSNEPAPRQENKNPYSVKKENDE